MKNFRTYDLAVDFYKETLTLNLPRHLKDQLSRAASSVALNLAEGSGKSSKKDQKRFFEIAFGSLRECQAVLDLTPTKPTSLEALADKLAAHLYKLIQKVAEAA